MFCNNCGTKNEDGDMFCMSCGARLTAVEQPTPQPIQQSVPQPVQQPVQQSQPVYAPPVAAVTSKEDGVKAVRAISVLLAVATVITMLMSWITIDVEERGNNENEIELIESMTAMTVFEVSEITDIVCEELDDRYEDIIPYADNSMIRETEDTMDKVSLANTALMIVKILICAAIALLVIFACLTAARTKGAVLSGVLGNVISVICSVGFMIAVGIINSNIDKIPIGEAPIEANMGIGLVLTLVFALVNTVVIIAGKKKL